MKKCGFVWCWYLFDDLFFESQNFTSRLVFFRDFSWYFGTEGFQYFGTTKRNTTSQSKKFNSRRVDIGGAKAKAMNGARDDLNFRTIYNWGAF